MLAYFNISFISIEERFWERRETFLRLTAAGTVPVLVKKNGLIIPHLYLITDYLLRSYDKHSMEGLLPRDEKLEMKAKSIAMWFDEKFFDEVSKLFLYEKVIHTLKIDEHPNVAALNVARYNFQIHLEFLEFLLAKNAFLAGESFSIADITAATHLSVLDYLSEIKWSLVSPSIKDWYSIIKSKLAFKEILMDVVPNIKPSITYEALDF